MPLDPPPTLVADDDWYFEHVLLAREGRETPHQTEWRLLAGRVEHLGPLGEIAGRQGFVATRSQAASVGFGDIDTRRMVRRGEWWHPRRGVIAPFPRPSQSAVFEIAAAALVRPGHIVHAASAAQLHDLPLIGSPPRGIALNGDVSRRLDRLAIRARSIDAADVVDWYGVPVTSVARTVCDVACLDRLGGLVVADAALQRELVTPADLERVASAVTSAGSRAARDVLRHADGLSESPLESITRLVIIDAGLPLPELQVEIKTPDRFKPYRVDMLWRRHRLILEADGRVKYTKDALWAEKDRQESLERAGYRVIRVRWKEVMHDRVQTIARITAALGVR